MDCLFDRIKEYGYFPGVRHTSVQGRQLKHNSLCFPSRCCHLHRELKSQPYCTQDSQNSIEFLAVLNATGLKERIC